VEVRYSKWWYLRYKNARVPVTGERPAVGVKSVAVRCSDTVWMDSACIILVPVV